MRMVKNIAHYGLLIVPAVFMLLPFLWMISTALMADLEVYQYPPTFVPSEPRWSNFSEALSMQPFGRFFLNTVIVAAVSVAGQLLFCSMAAYAFARLQFAWRDKIFGLYLATMMIPAIVTVIPAFLLINMFGWMNTYWALFTPTVSSVWGIFLLRQFFMTIPRDLEDAARIDGASEFTIFRKVVLPLSKPALATLAIFAFMGVWKDFLWPLLVTNRIDMRTVEVGIANFSTLYSTDWPHQMAAAVVVMLPVIIVFLLTQKHFIRGITMTGMKMVIWTVVLPGTLLFAQDGMIPAFEIKQTDIVLERLAQPGTYFDKVGRKFAILGNEGGSFEAWAYPLKLFRNVQFSFFIGSSTEAVEAKDIVRYISVDPAVTRLTYTFQSFTVQALFIASISEPGGYVLLDVNTTEPLTIVVSVLPVLQPMWPAGIGGQSARWMSDLNAYQVTEPTRNNTAYIGSPAATGISYTPAHMLSDVPNQFKIEIPKPEAVRGRFIPIVMTGGRGERDSIRTTFVRLTKTIESQYHKTAAHYRDLRAQTMKVETPNRDLNLAFEWAKISYDNLLVDNPDVGLGMVAGLGASGTGGRPGFGWFFGGDTYINSFSLVAYGALKTVRDALAFTQKWQREDGKMAHELTQAAAYVNWWEDYPYGYIHGDTSPFYICAMGDYYDHSGDSLFVRESWKSLRKAYDWSLATDENNDGLMDNKKAGLGALEYGPLTDIQSDIYAGAIWVRAAGVMPKLARVAGDREFERTSEEYKNKAGRAFKEKFWDAKHRQYSYAFTAKGEHVDIVSPWSAVGLMWMLGDSARSVPSLQKLNSAELTTDWGIRSISNKSAYFEPLNYSYGAVWPFLTSWVATAQYKHGFSLQGFNSLMSTVRHTFDNSLGQVTEVFSGSQNIWPQEAVAHQGFCTAGAVLPLVRGMFGLEPDAANRTLAFSPQLPADWSQLIIRNYRVGGHTFNFEFAEDNGWKMWRIVASEPGFTLRFHQRLSQDARIRSVKVHGGGHPDQQYEPSGSDIVLETPVGGERIIEIAYEPGFDLLSPVIDTRTGDVNTGLKIISTEWKGQRLTIVVEGLAGQVYELGVIHPKRAKSVSGAELKGSTLIIGIPAGLQGEFLRKSIVVETKAR